MVESLERVDGLRRRLMDIDQSLVRTDLEVLAGILVLERRTDHAIHVLLRGQRNGTGNGRASARRRLDDLLRGRFDRRVVVGLQANTDLVLSNGCHGKSFAFVLSQYNGAVSVGGPTCPARVRRICLDKKKGG